MKVTPKRERPNLTSKDRLLRVVLVLGCLLLLRLARLWHHANEITEYSQLLRVGGSESSSSYGGQGKEESADDLPSTSNSSASISSSAGVTVDEGDYIYSLKSWNAAPVVLKPNKLLFFTIQKTGCTVWKQLFRRMMGHPDWNDPSVSMNPKTNGLDYLTIYPLQEATNMMNDPSYTRAIFVRDPKARFLSAYLDKVKRLNGSFFQNACCNKRASFPDCQERIANDSISFEDFFQITESCLNTHWAPQIERMEQSKYWKTINFVGHTETAKQDAKRLLEQVGAWDEFGKSGWGQHGNESIFQSTGTVVHATSSNTGTSQRSALEHLRKYYTPELELLVERRFQKDYDHELFGLQKYRIFE